MPCPPTADPRCTADRVRLAPRASPTRHPIRDEPVEAFCRHSVFGQANTLQFGAKWPITTDLPIVFQFAPNAMPISPASSAAAIGLSGMRAAQQRLDTQAHNIANAQTPGFQRQTVVQTAQAGGGVNTAVGREAPRPTDGAGFGAGLVEDIVGQRLSLYSFAANLKTVQTQDDMLGALLDTKV